MNDDDHTKDDFMLFYTPSGKSEWYRKFMDSMKTAEPKYIAVDWAADSGMIRGDVIKRVGNVIHARFKTVGV